MIKEILVLGSVALLLSACSGRARDVPWAEVPAAPATEVKKLGDDEVLSRLGILKAQALASGECGLFLWMKRDDAPLVFFQRSDGRAYMVVDDVETVLSRTSYKDRVALEYYERQQFSTGDVILDVTITPETRRSLQQGLKLPVASMALEVAGGWSAVVPAVGMIGCK